MAVLGSESRGSCWTQVLAAKELYKGKEVGIFLNAFAAGPGGVKKSFKASKKCFFVLVVVLLKNKGFLIKVG